MEQEALDEFYGKCSLMKGCHKRHLELLRTGIRQAS